MPTTDADKRPKLQSRDLVIGMRQQANLAWMEMVDHNPNAHEDLASWNRLMPKGYKLCVEDDDKGKLPIYVTLSDKRI